MILLGRDLRSRVEQVNRRLTSVEGQLADSRGHFSEVRAAHDRLELLVQQAESLVQRSKTNIEELTGREAHVQELAVKMRRVVDEIRQIFAGLKRAAANTRHAERDAGQMCDRLYAQTERSKRIAAKLDHVATRLVRDVAAGQSPPSSIIKAASSPAADQGPPPTLDAGNVPLQERFQKMLDRSRESLSDLRTLVRGEHGDGSDTKQSCDDTQVTPDAMEEKPPTQRLADGVDSLLAMVESRRV